MTSLNSNHWPLDFLQSKLSFTDICVSRLLYLWHPWLLYKFCMCTSYSMKVTCLARKSVCPQQPDRTCLKPWFLKLLLLTGTFCLLFFSLSKFWGLPCHLLVMKILNHLVYVQCIYNYLSLLRIINNDLKY